MMANDRDLQIEAKAMNCLLSIQLQYLSIYDNILINAE